jgi:hypothetical protein
MGKKDVKKAQKSKARTERHLAGGQREKQVDVLLKIAGGVMAVSICAGFAATVMTGAPTPFKQLSASSAELPDVFFGGQPWLVLCSDSKGILDKTSGDLKEKLALTAKDLREGQYKINTGVLDCSAKLPSGRTTYERLKVSSKTHPVAFLAMGGEPVVKLPAKQLRTKSTEALSTNIVARVRDRFNLVPVKDSKSLQKRCGDRKLCVGLFGFGEPDEEYGSAFNAASRQFPKVRWSYVDTSRFVTNIKPSSKDGLGKPLRGFGVVRGATKNESHIALLEMSKYPSDKDLSEFIKTLSATGFATDANKLIDPLSMELNEASKERLKMAKAKRAAKKREAAAAAFQAQKEAKAALARAKAEKDGTALEREQRRRQQMEEETAASAHFAQAVEEDPEAAEEGDDEEGGDDDDDDADVYLDADSEDVVDFGDDDEEEEGEDLDDDE